MDLLKIVLGVVTGIAGFLDAGSIATAAQAGATYRYTLIWAVLLGTLTIIFNLAGEYIDDVYSRSNVIPIA